MPGRAHGERRALLLAAIGDEHSAHTIATWPPMERLSRRIATAVVVAIFLAGIVALVGRHAAKPPLADAAIVRHTADALALAPGTILHERAHISLDGRTWKPYELWSATNDPHRYRVIKFGREFTRDGASVSTYSAAANTVTETLAPPEAAADASVDIADEMRSLVQSGEARVTGTTTVDRTAVYRLTLGPASSATPAATAYVNERDYHPVLLDYSAAGGETIRYQAFEYLPATAANLALLDVAAQHPTARSTFKPPRARHS
jgi:hypothetical protein